MHPLGLERTGLAAVLQDLTNAAKHAHAAHVAVHVAATAQALELTVDDDGEGIERGRVEQAVGQGHIGVASIIERIRAVGGHVEVRTAPGDGTSVRVTVPLVSTPAA
jgi:two-component system, NarL family, sensor kinase